MIPIKLMVIGDGAVGKTCLLTRYVMREFPREYVPAVFDSACVLSGWSLVSALSLTLASPQGGISLRFEDRAINVGLWDSAGQDAYVR